jgi:hypothetical protein
MPGLEIIQEDQLLVVEVEILAVEVMEDKMLNPNMVQTL